MTQEQSAQAETRVMRTIVVVFGIVALVFLALNFTSIVQQSAYLHPAWTISSALIVFGLPPALALTSPALKLVQLRRGLASYAIAFAAIIIGFVPAMVARPMPSELSPWPLGLYSMSAVAAALAWRAPLAWGYLVVVSLLVVPVRVLAAGPEYLTRGLQDALFSVGFVALFTALALVTMRNARAVDAAAADARSVATRAASAAARSREQARLDALIHDEIMTSLLYAADYTAEIAGAVQAQATRALAELGRLNASDGSAPGAVSAQNFTSRVRSTVLELSSATVVEVRGDREQQIPGEVAAAFAEATSEAVRNSLLHAGPDGRTVQRAVVVTLDDSVSITIEDDGVGFNPRTVPPHRLGIAASIRGRLAAVPGGRARVRSRPGDGTLVTLDWTAP